MSRGPRTARRAALAAERRPVRACVACRARRPQDELVRVTVLDGRLMPDGPPGASRRPGRGAYLCEDATCVARAIARDALLLRRALRTRATAVVPEELERVGSPAS
jgi:predicted RNA-binding protein YlxR (DUF448 family)